MGAGRGKIALLRPFQPELSRPYRASEFGTPL